MYDIEDIDVIWMRYAITLADCAGVSGEISVGAVLIYNGSIIGYGWNSSIMYNDPTAHAEILALRMGGGFLGNYRLLGTTLYVTLEPCMMCVGAILHARIYRLVCGAIDNKIECKRRMWLRNILQNLITSHRILLTTSILEKECAMRLSNFFIKKRKSYWNKNIV